MLHTYVVGQLYCYVIATGHSIIIIMQVIQKYHLRTDKEKLEVDFAAVVRPKGDVPIYFEDRQ